MNEGSEAEGIDGYNGGLFRPNEFIDALAVLDSSSDRPVTWRNHRRRT